MSEWKSNMSDLVESVKYHMSGFTGEEYRDNHEIDQLILDTANDLEQCFDVVEDDSELIAAQVLQEMGIYLN